MSYKFTSFLQNPQYFKMENTSMQKLGNVTMAMLTEVRQRQGKSGCHRLTKALSNTTYTVRYLGACAAAERG